MKFIEILGSRIDLPLQFSTPLPFSEEDKRLLPWLSNTPRRYSLTKEVGKGGRATAYRGFVVGDDGQRRTNSPDIVIKIPNLDSNSPYSARQVQQFLMRQNQEGSREWQLTRGRLRGCQYANPIFDFESYPIVWLNELLQIPISVQLWLDDALPLDEYLLKTGDRNEVYRSQQGKPVDNWLGMKSAEGWIKLARSIAVGLADIHRRRVVHGDIWPPNVFMKEGTATPILIDFGEAFPLEPKGESQSQRDHAYRAPERSDAQSIVTQQADVYSFGKLLLHLATGEEPILPPAIRGHKRRDSVRLRMRQRNQALINDNPYIMDLICNCITVDPTDRPSMEDVVRALDSYVDFRRWKSSTRIGIEAVVRNLLARWQSVSARMSENTATVAPFLEELIRLRLTEVDSMIESLAEQVLVLRDTRERLIVSLVSLFHDLNSEDRYISLTSPRMWQGSALGLDGRYFTASKLAASRGAVIQRLFVVSAQELGIEWCQKLIRSLRAMPTEHPARLARAFDSAVADFQAVNRKGEAQEMHASVKRESQLRLRLVIKSYADSFNDFGSTGFQTTDFTDSQSGTNSFVGLLVCGTMQEVREIKAAHPVSVFHYNASGGPGQYLLLMTDCHGRTPPGIFPGGTKDDLLAGEPKPELRGITVFKSVLGVPQDRIKLLEQVFRQSINIGHWCVDLNKALHAIEEGDISQDLTKQIVSKRSKKKR